VAIFDGMVTRISFTTCIPVPAKTEDTPNTPSLAYGAWLGAFPMAKGTQGTKMLFPEVAQTMLGWQND
jgi:hypothetical protein